MRPLHQHDTITLLHKPRAQDAEIPPHAARALYALERAGPLEAYVQFVARTPRLADLHEDVGADAVDVADADVRLRHVRCDEVLAEGAVGEEGRLRGGFEAPVGVVAGGVLVEGAVDAAVGVLDVLVGGDAGLGDEGAAVESFFEDA